MTKILESTALAWVCRLAAAGVFLYAGIAKLGDPAGFATTVSRYELFPALANLVAMTFPWMEVLLGLCLLVGIWPRAAGLGMCLLYAVFFPAIFWALFQGLKVDCGCFGGDQPLSWFTALRDLVFVLPSAVCALTRAHRGVLAPG